MLGMSQGKNHLSIRPLSIPLCPVQGRGGLEPATAHIGRQVWYTSDRSPAYHRADIFRVVTYYHQYVLVQIKICGKWNNSSRAWRGVGGGGGHVILNIGYCFKFATNVNISR